MFSDRLKFAENLKRLRGKFGMTQKQLAKELNMSQQAIAKWETGKSEPSHEMTIRLSEFFGVTLDELLGNEKPPSLGRYTQNVEGQPLRERAIIAIEKMGSFHGVELNPLPQSINVPEYKQIVGEKFYLDDGADDDWILTWMDCNFVMLCPDDSMIDVGISRGDVVYVRTQQSVHNGDVAVIIYKNRLLIRRVNFINDDIVLIANKLQVVRRIDSADDEVILDAENSQYSRIVLRGENVENMTIVGKVLFSVSTKK